MPADSEEAQPHLTVPQFPPRWGCSGNSSGNARARLGRERCCANPGSAGARQQRGTGAGSCPGVSSTCPTLRWLQGRGASPAGAARHRGDTQSSPVLLLQDRSISPPSNSLAFAFAASPPSPTGFGEGVTCGSHHTPLGQAPEWL